MEIQVARLREVMELMKPAVPRKPTLPALKNFLLEEGKAVATNLETMVIVEVPEATETYLLPFEDVSKVIDYVHGAENLVITSNNGTATFTWGGGKASFDAGEPKEFPSLPDFAVKSEADLDGDTLINAMYTMVSYTSKEDDRPVLSGVTAIFGEPIEMAAGDGFRMAHKVLSLLFPGNETVIIPYHSVLVLKHLFAKTPRTPPPSEELVPVIIAKKRINVALDGKTGLRVGFGTGATAIVKLIDGKPPAWLKLIPKGEPALEAQVFAPEFLTSVHRVANIASKSNNIVRLVFNDNVITISAREGNQEVEATLDTLAMTGEPGRCAINLNYLTGYLKDKQGIVTLGVYDEKSPVTFKSGVSAPVVIIMPMFADWGDSQPGEEQPAADASDQVPETENPEPEPGPEPEPKPKPKTKPRGKKSK